MDIQKLNQEKERKRCVMKKLKLIMKPGVAGGG